MKIKKLVESKILEDVVDPENKSEVATEIENQTDISEKEADKLATEITNDADAVGASQAVLAIDEDADYEDANIVNDITEALDGAYADSLYFLKSGESETSNVLIEGLPGSGKTAIVSNWCAKHKLELLQFNATDPKLEASLNGIPLRDLSFENSDEEGTAEAQRITYAYNIKKVEKLLNDKHPDLAGKCVIFVDELNRQKSQQLRRPFMSLFNEKRNADGTLDFSKNLLFSVICINPYGEKFHDPGVGELVPAELNRFLNKITFDSTTASSNAFFDGWIKGKLLDLGIVPPNSKASDRRNGFYGPLKELSADELALAKSFIKRYELAHYILNHYEFRFDERKDAENIWREHKDYLTSRLFTNGIAKSQGDPKAFLNWVDKQSGLSQRAVQMFHKILDSYIMDEKELWQDYGLEKAPDLTKAAANTDTTAASSNNTEAEADDLFDDDDVTAAGNSTKNTTSDESEIRSAMDDWDF